MKWLCNMLSWCFTCMAMALLSLLVGSFVLNAKVKANSYGLTSAGVPPPANTAACYTCAGATPYTLGHCPEGSQTKCPDCGVGDNCPR